jgi:FAD/FMN-containing dehydrogenase
MGFALENYHEALDTRLAAKEPGSEMLTELDVPLERLPEFLEDVRAAMKEQGFAPIYGTVRLVEKDDGTFLPYARTRTAAVNINLHVAHSPAGMEAASARFRRLIDLARARGGSFYLTYHRFATKEQIEACYPQFRDFLARKEQLDPQGRFQSEWFRSMKTMFQP